jgi:hypothetical protein
MKKIRILFWSDGMGCCGESTEKEAKYAEYWFRELVFDGEKKKFTFKIAEGPMSFEENNYDVLVFDFGGIGLGCGGLIDSLSYQLLTLIKDRPSTLFIAWSTFTNRYLEEACEEELGKFPNLITVNESVEETVAKTKKWFKEIE